jgi:hypothetical protein
LTGQIEHSGALDLQGVLNQSGRVGHNTPMNDPLAIDPRRRIRELLAIPERDRTDEQWDELNELEIRTAPGNRESDRSMDRQPDKRQGPPGQVRRPNPNQGPRNIGPRPDSRPPQEGRAPQEGRPPQEGRQDGRPPKRQHRRPKRPPVETPGTGNT